MNIKRLACPQCNAELDIDLDNLQAYCQYCGQKLSIDLDNGEQKLMIDKEITKRVIHRENEQTKRKQLEYEHEASASDKKWKRICLATVAGSVLLIVFGFIIPNFRFKAQLKMHDEKIAQLLKANKLYYEEKGWTDDYKEEWDEKRENYIKMIEEKIKEQEIKDPNNVFMSASSKELEGQVYTEVVDKLKTMGFTNVISQPAAQKASLFRKKNTVEHILVGDVTKFTEEDYFNKDTKIIVYYYAKK